MSDFSQEELQRALEDLRRRVPEYTGYLVVDVIFEYVITVILEKYFILCLLQFICILIITSSHVILIVKQ